MPPPPPRPGTSRSKLDAVRRETRQLLSDGASASSWIELDALREYLGGRYGFDGLESTTDEVLSRLKTADARRSREDRGASVT